MNINGAQRDRRDRLACLANGIEPDPSSLDGRLIAVNLPAIAK